MDIVESLVNTCEISRGFLMRIIRFVDSKDLLTFSFALAVHSKKMFFLCY